MNTFLVQHLRKKRELYDNDESVKIVVRVVGNDRKKMNISTGIEIRFRIGKKLTTKIQYPNLNQIHNRKTLF